MIGLRVVGMGLVLFCGGNLEAACYSPHCKTSGTTVVSWSTTSGWAAEGAGSSLASETSITPPYGGDAVRLSNSNAGGVGQASIYTLTPVNFGNADVIIEVPFYVPTDHIGGDVSVLIGSGGAFTNRYAKSWSSSKTATGWNLYRFAIADMTKTGIPDLTAIDSIRIKCTAPAGVTTYAVFGPITINRTYRPWIVLSFDDGLQTVYTAAKPLLDARGLKATVFVNYANLYGATTLSNAQLNALYAAGWDVSNHTYTHGRMQTDGLTTDQKTTEIVLGQSSLGQYPRSHKFLAWPGGEHDDVSDAIAQSAGVLLARTTQNDPFPISKDGLYDRWRVPGWSFDSASRTADQVVLQMRAAALKGETAIWYGHNIVTPTVLSTDVSVESLTTILDAVVALRDSGAVQVGTLTEMYNAITQTGRPAATRAVRN